MIRAYIFDLDGTIVDTEILWVAATEAFLADRQIPVEHEWAVSAVYGRSWRDVYQTLRAAAPGLHDLSMPEMQDAIDPYFRRLREARDVRIPGTISLLRRLATRAPVCIVSGSPRRDVDRAVGELGLGSLLAFSLAAEDYDRGKPDPACYLLAAGRLAVPPRACVAFEDSAAGVRAAKAAGMRCVALVRGNAPPQDVSAADLVLNDLADYVES